MAQSCSRILVMVAVTLLVSGPAVVRAAESALPPKMLTGDDFFIPDKPIVGYLTVQPRYTMAENEDGTSSDYFSLRRLKLRILGELGAGLRYYGQGIYKTHNDSATDNQIFLQEARLTWKFLPSLDLQVGQFKPSLSFGRTTDMAPLPAQE